MTLREKKWRYPSENIWHFKKVLFLVMQPFSIQKHRKNRGRFEIYCIDLILTLSNGMLWFFFIIILWGIKPQIFVWLISHYWQGYFSFLWSASKIFSFTDIYSCSSFLFLWWSSVGGGQRSVYLAFSQAETLLYLCYKQIILCMPRHCYCCLYLQPFFTTAVQALKS